MHFPSELLPLRNARLESGFTGCYPHRGKWRWCEPFVKRHHAGHDTPVDAALQLLGWWRAHFGDDWVRYFRGRSAVPWVARQTPSGSWSLLIYVRGHPRPVPPPRRPLDSRAAARRYLMDFCRRRYGADSWRVVRRVAPPTPLEVAP